MSAAGVRLAPPVVEADASVMPPLDHPRRDGHPSCSCMGTGRRVIAGRFGDVVDVCPACRGTGVSIKSGVEDGEDDK